MNKYQVVTEICNQIKSVCDRVGSLTAVQEMCDIDLKNPEYQPDESILGFKDMSIEQRMDELEHMQRLVLKLTEIMTADAEQHLDEAGSVFGATELTSEKEAEVEEKTPLKNEEQ